MLLILYLLSIFRATFPYTFARGKIFQFPTELRSYGDPDNSDLSRFSRWLQKSIRVCDQIVFPNEVDTPGLTFPTPIIWAPWLETIWFGNAYDYRAAFFHDVMYSNNLPFKEGALFYRNKNSAQKIALLYQRYKKFDLSSYSAQNATFYNIFCDQSLRIGRFKYPLTDELILCVMDPMTFSDMRRYLNTFNLIKLFQKKYFQIKRKRQVVLNIKNPLFLNEVVHTIEYSHIEELSNNKGGKDKIHIIPVLSPIHISAGTSGLRVSSANGNSQHFLEILFQSILKNLINLKKNKQGLRDEIGRDKDDALTVFIGGDGRYLNTLAIDIFLRIAAGNNVKKVFLTSNNIMSTPSASALLRQSTNNIDAAILLTASHNAGGPRGFFGVKINLEGGVTASDELWADIVRDAASMKEFRAVACRPPTLPIYDPSVATASKQNKKVLLETSTSINTKYGPNTKVETINDIPNYVNFLKKSFDLPFLKQFIETSSLSVVFDCMHGAAGSYIKAILGELGIDSTCIIRSKNLPDFGGFKPDPNRANAGDMQELFQFPDIDVTTLLADVEEVPFQQPMMLVQEAEANSTANLTSEIRRGAERLPDSPDIGFSFDADVDRCMILGPGLMVSPSDSLAVIAAHHTAIPLFRNAGGLRATARSIVTAPAVDAVAEALGLTNYQTPVGWKWISRLFQQLPEQTGLAGEESFGLGSSALPEKDGIWAALAWLTVLASENKDRVGGGFVGVDEVLRRHWQRFGRCYSLRLDFGDMPSTDAQTVLERIASLSERQAAGWTPPPTRAPATRILPPSDVEVVAEGPISSPQQPTLLFMDQEPDGGSLMTRERVTVLAGEGTEASKDETSLEVTISTAVPVEADPLADVLTYLHAKQVSIRRHKYETAGQSITTSIADYVIETGAGGRVLFRVSGTEPGSGKESVVLRVYLDQKSATYNRSTEEVLAPLVMLAYKVAGLNIGDNPQYPSLVT